MAEIATLYKKVWDEYVVSEVIILIAVAIVALFGEVRGIIKPDGIPYVLPMYVEEWGATMLAKDKGFELKGKEANGHVLVFSRQRSATLNYA